MVPPLLNHQRQRGLTVRFVVYLYPDVIPSWDAFSILNNMFRSMKRRFRSLDGGFGSIYRRFRSMSGRFSSMNRQFQLTCLHCVLKIHHNNEYRETRGTLSLRRNLYGSHFLPFLAWRNHFGGGNFYGMTVPCSHTLYLLCILKAT